MASLATIADVEVRIGRSFSEQDDIERVQALLDDASAAVRTYTRRQFGSGTFTRRVRLRDGRARLSYAVTDVTSVVNLNGDAVTYSWDGLNVVATGSGFERFDLDVAPSFVVDVTYTYDSGPVPEVIVAVVCQMAARAYGVKADQTGVQQQSIAGYSYSVGAAAAAGGVGMLDSEKALLDPFRPALIGNAWVRGR